MASSLFLESRFGVNQNPAGRRDSALARSDKASDK